MIPTHPSPADYCSVNPASDVESVEQLQTLAEVDRDAWDRLAPDDVFGSYGWLRTLEETALTRRPVYFVARQAGALVAAAPCSCEVPEGSGMDRLVFGRFARLARALRMGISPALICGSPIGLSQHVRVDPTASSEDRQRWTMLLIDAMEAHARRHSMTLCFANVVDRVGPLSGILNGRQYLRASDMPTTVMDIRWSTFAEYQSELRRNHPATSRYITKEINRARRKGIIFRKLADDIPQAPRLHALLDAHYRRLNGVAFPFRPAFLETLKRHLGTRMIVYVAFDAGNPVGVTVALRGGDALFLPIGGTDIAWAGKTLVYFNNSYNVPIDDAIATGARRIYCGKLLYDVKIRRGFGLVDLGAYIHVPNRLHAALLAPALASQRMRIQSMLRDARPAKPSGANT